jgi:hypothetical protein
MIVHYHLGHGGAILLALHGDALVCAIRQEH